MAEPPETFFIYSVDPDYAEQFLSEVKGEAQVEIVQRLDERSFLCRCGVDFRPLFALHRFSVQYRSRVSNDSLAVLAAEELMLADLKPGLPYAFQLSANQRLECSFGRLIPLWVERLGLRPELLNARNPRQVISVYFHKTEGGLSLYSGVNRVENNLSPWSQGVCRIPKAREAVSRAEQKLLEALELVSLPTPGQALDLGAAPGGWSRIMGTLGWSVDAVDPADLDPAVARMGEVTHHRTTAGEFLRGREDSYDLMICDMKMDAVLCGKLLCHHVSALRARGLLIATLKLSKGKTALPKAQRALTEIRRAYTIVQARQLYFNRHEVTLIARPRSG